MKQNMTASDIRALFLSYFQEHGHAIIPSAPLVPEHDPTLLFVNSGMVPFKDLFLGKELRDYNCAASAQSCLRLAGKHNDFNEVGFTQRHHTFFEMLGNFSFGAYFKEPAMRFAWTFLTQYLGIPAERLWVSVYEEDDESYALWRDVIGLPAARIVRCGAEDNFWSMGDFGPCGPCTEIFYDHGPELAGGPPGSEDSDGPRYMEIWNIVFMQYDRQPSGLTPLAVPCVDTGMGLERITAVMQGVSDTYDIDIFRRLMNVMVADVGDVFPLHVKKIVTDHMRATVMLMSQGVFPGATGRQYVLRRLIRRALRYAYQAGVAIPCLGRWAEEMIAVMSEMYPEIVEMKDKIIEALSEEERKFSATLQQGMRLLDRALEQLDGNILDGALAFKLYDTYGFPLDVTQDIIRERGYVLDVAGFDLAMSHQKSMSRADVPSIEDRYTMDLTQHVTQFLYHRLSAQVRILACYDAEQQEVDGLSAGSKGWMVFDQTVCYPEGGGQAGDQGDVFLEDLRVLHIEDSQRHRHAVVHEVSVLEDVRVGDGLLMCTDASRIAVRAHHTATHLLHAALRAVLGPQALQKGSWVDADRLRFDFSWHRPLTPEELVSVEAWVRRAISADLPVSIEEMSYEVAKQSGALGLFEAQYGQMVRVVSIEGWSRELCGGTHARATSELGDFLILESTSIASGIRRIEAVTAAAGMQRYRAARVWTQECMSVVQASDQASCLDKIKKMREQIERLQSQIALQALDTHWNMLQEALKATPLGQPCVVHIDATQDHMMELLDRAKLMHSSWVTLIGTPSKESTPVVSACREASLEETERWVARLAGCASVRLGSKPGLVRGVFQKVLDAQELRSALEA